MKLFSLLLLLAFSLQPSAFAQAKPDPKLTPGDILTNVTVAQLLAPGYAQHARKVSAALKRQVFIEYFGKVPAHPGDYEIDHLIPLELGGSNDIKNLWPQPIAEARKKDQLENTALRALRKNPTPANLAAQRSQMSHFSQPSHFSFSLP